MIWREEGYVGIFICHTPTQRRLSDLEVIWRCIVRIPIVPWAVIEREECPARACPVVDAWHRFGKTRAELHSEYANDDGVELVKVKAAEVSVRKVCDLRPDAIKPVTHSVVATTDVADPCVGQSGVDDSDFDFRWSNVSPWRGMRFSDVENA